MDISTDPPQFFSQDKIIKDLQAILEICEPQLKKNVDIKIRALKKLDGQFFYLEAAKTYSNYIDHCAQTDHFPKVSIQKITGKGLGLVAEENLVRGVYLGTYTGQIIVKKVCDTEELHAFLKKAHAHLDKDKDAFFKILINVSSKLMKTRMYRLEIGQEDSDYVIDAINMGSHIRYVNDADSESGVNIQHELYFNKNKLPHRAYITSKVVKKGEELLVNYGPEHLKHCRSNQLQNDLKEILEGIGSSSVLIVQKVTGILECCQYLFPRMSPFPKQDTLAFLQELSRTVDTDTGL
jgi:hypothetical protein